MHNKSQDQKNSRNLVADIMSKQLNNDSTLTSKMIPDFALGCRRMTPGSGYLQSLTKENVSVNTSSVAKFTEKGIIDETGQENEVDVVICATGFNVSFTPQFEVIGRGGKSLKEEFGELPKTYLAVTAADFPNLFRVYMLLYAKLSTYFFYSTSWLQRSCKPWLCPPNLRLAHPVHVFHDRKNANREHQMLHA